MRRFIGDGVGMDRLFYTGNIGIGHSAGIIKSMKKAKFPKMKCEWCGKKFDSIMADCGTGYTWSLYKCPHCKGEMAEGRIIPKVVLDDPKIKTKQLPPIGKRAFK